MRTLVHISDLHFGRVHPPTLAPLAQAIKTLAPDVVVVSGDLTQRAKSAEFLEARTFLDQLPHPQIVVPGNHDIPLYNVVDRFLQPLEKYHRYITTEMAPFHMDDEIAILGVNTARSLTIQDGRINDEQRQIIESRFEPSCCVGRVKFLVTHHPFDLPEGSFKDRVGGADETMAVLARCDVDVVLAGHLHLGHTLHTAKRFKIDGHSALMVHAGTATSSRLRGGEENSFNVLRIEPRHITVERLHWNPSAEHFESAGIEIFDKTEKGWVRMPDLAPQQAQSA